MLKLLKFIPVLLIIMYLSGCSNNDNQASNNTNTIPYADSIIYINNNLEHNENEVFYLCKDKILLDHVVSFSKVSSEEEPTTNKSGLIRLHYNRPQILKINYPNQYLIEYIVTDIYIGFDNPVSGVIYLQHPKETGESGYAITSLFINNEEQSNIINSQLKKLLIK